MNTHSDKPAKSGSQAVANNVSQAKSAPGIAPQSMPAQPVVQRALGADDKENFLAWVTAQADLRGIKARFRMPLLARANEIAGGMAARNLAEAQGLMNTRGVFTEFVNKSALIDRAEAANRSEGITIALVEAVLIYLGARTDAFLGNGQTVYVRPLGGGDLDKNCHHYAFGGLKGADASFNFDTLRDTLNLNAVPSGGNVDARAINGVNNEGVFVVRNYGMAHSAREEDGMVWHKFVGVPCLFAIPTAADLGNNVEKTFRVTSASASILGKGTFDLGPPAD